MPKMTKNPDPLVEARTAARSGEILYAPHVLKHLLSETLAQYDVLRYRSGDHLGIWRGECGHVWDRRRELTTECPRCRDRAVMWILAGLLGVALVAMIGIA